MQPGRALLLTLLLAAVPLAGCFGSEAEVVERTFTATGGKASEGWAYDGVGLVDAAATLDGRVNNAENSGLVTVSFQLAGSDWAVTFDQFAGAPDKPFMDGGIAFDLAEHGDTGIADTSIPQILALVAAWGKATVTRDGEPVLGKDGNPLWSAHLMVSDTTVRGSDGKIAKADGASPYDPASPADARRIEGQRQVLFWIKSPDGEAAKAEDEPVTGSATFLGPETTQTIDVPTTKGGRVTLNLTATGNGNPLALGQVSFRLVDENGTEVAPAVGGSVTPSAPFSGVLEADNVPGPLKLEITGQGAFTARVDGVAKSSDVPFVVLTWNEVTLG